MLHSTETHEALQHAWSNLPISTILKAHWKQTKLIQISSTMKIEQAFDILVSNSINAAPIYNEEKKAYTGMISLADVGAYIVFLAGLDQKTFQELETQEEKAIKISQLVECVRKRESVPVTIVSDFSAKDPLICVPHDCTLLLAMQHFARGINRIMVQNNTQIVGIVSQSDVIKFLSQNDKTPPFNAILSSKISQLQLCERREIISVRSFDRVYDALSMMVQQNVSSVAVVDSNTKLLGNISSSDIKHVLLNLQRGLLFESCSQFINSVKTRQMLKNSGKDIVPVIQVSMNAILSQVLRLLLVTNVHRVWVTESCMENVTYQCPITVISMTDILRVFV